MLFFEVRVKFDKMMENGVIKRVTEAYAVDAMTFTEAEARITDQMRPYIQGNFEVVAEKRAKYNEIKFDDGDIFFLVKFNLITTNDAGQEKRAPLHVMFRENDFDEAKKAAKTYMKESMVDYEIEFIKETKIMDVFMRDPVDD